MPLTIQAQYEARYQSQEERLRGEIASLTEHAEFRAVEIKRLQNTIESYKLSNEELNVSSSRFLSAVVHRKQLVEKAVWAD